MEQLVLLLIIAGISLINWLVEKSKKLREEKRLEQARSQRTQTPPALPREEPVTTPRVPQEDESSEQMRRLLEAMGIPTEFPGEPATPEPVPSTLPEPPPPPAPPLPPPAPARPSLRKKRTTSVSTASQPTAWRKRLHSQTALREAIVLREILGPPRALSQP